MCGDSATVRVLIAGGVRGLAEKLGKRGGAGTPEALGSSTASAVVLAGRGGVGRQERILSVPG